MDRVVSKLVLVLQGLVGCEDLLRSAPAALRHMAEQSEVFRLQPLRPEGLPEAAWLGLEPLSIRLEAGPLVVAALGADPPDRSVQFQLDLLSVGDTGAVGQPAVLPTAEETREIKAAAARLATKRLTPVIGNRLTHGLVWEEGSLDLGTTPDPRPEGIHPSLPQGDGEKILRQFIDDSVNLLDEQEFNHRRRDEGVEPLNLLWPWGQGFRTPVPNLGLRRGEVVYVYSRSMRLRGLSRLVGYIHPSEVEFCPGVFPPKSQLDALMPQGSKVAVLDFSDFVAHDRFDDAERALVDVADMLDRWLGHPEKPTEVLCLATGATEGLGFSYRSLQKVTATAPFDTRALGESKISLSPVFERIAQTLGG